MAGQASEIDDVRVITLPDFVASRRACFGDREPNMVQIGLPEFNLVLRIKGIPKIYKTLVDYDIDSRCHKIGLFSKHWKPNSYLGLIDYCHVVLPKTTVVSLEVIEWSRIISSVSSRSTRPSVPSLIGESGTESG